MSDYIDREAAIRAVNHHLQLDEEYAWGVREALRAVPSADVKPVVRCEDCKHSYDAIGGTFCSYGVCVDCVVESDFYCAYGERGEDNG